MAFSGVQCYCPRHFFTISLAFYGLLTAQVLFASVSNARCIWETQVEIVTNRLMNETFLHLKPIKMVEQKSPVFTGKNGIISIRISFFFFFCNFYGDIIPLIVLLL